MIFFVQSDGTITHIDPVPIYQGSANANTIYFVGAFAENNPVGVAFKLPNGIWTKPYLAFNGEEQNVPNMTFVLRFLMPKRKAAFRTAFGKFSSTVRSRNFRA